MVIVRSEPVQFGASSHGEYSHNIAHKKIPMRYVQTVCSAAISFGERDAYGRASRPTRGDGGAFRSCCGSPALRVLRHDGVMGDFWPNAWCILRAVVPLQGRATCRGCRASAWK